MVFQKMSGLLSSASVAFALIAHIALKISQRQIGGKASLNRSKLSKQLRKQLENVRKFAEGIEPGNPIWSPAPSRHSGTL